MRLHRFYILQTIDKEKINSFSNKDQIHQLRRVFRLHAGDTCIFFDGSGEDHVCEIVSMTDVKLEFKVLETYSVKPISTKLSLAVSLIKKDNFEWVIQKGTELGVSEFIPLISERSEKKGFNMERARKIMIEAVEQSGRADVPTIFEPVDLDVFLETEKRGLVVFNTTGINFFSKKSKEKINLVVCIGPEGGWSEKEIEKFKNKGAEIVKLDTPILRTETAAVAIATLFLAQK